MNKALIFAGFLVGMSSVSGMSSSENGLSEKPAFEYNESSNTLVCRNMAGDDFKKCENYLDCALHVSFDNCILSQGVFCTNAWMLSFNKCCGIKKREDVFKYVGLYYTSCDEASVYIDGEYVSE